MKIIEPVKTGKSPEAIFKGMKHLISITLAGLLIAPCLSSAQTWTRCSGFPQVWRYSAASADGTKGWGVLTNNLVLYSTNSGIDWAVLSTRPTLYFFLNSIACSADGTNIILAGGKYNGSHMIYTSTNFGATWVSNNVPEANWTTVASSADGTKLAAASAGGGVYFTTNSGGDWTKADISPTAYWISVTCSADGSLFAAAATNGLICVSTNCGSTWVTNGSINSNPSQVAQKSGSFVTPKANAYLANTNWQSVACSADKTRLAAVVKGGPICLSEDSGATWTISSAPYTNWQLVASSADGTRLAAAINNGPIYTSVDSGATWVSNTIPNAGWNSLVSSADGCKLKATYLYGYAYNLQITPHPALRLAVASSNLAFSWIKPSTNFVLQQSADLSAWTGITNSPILNISNLQYQVSLASSNRSGFYRLIQQ